MRTDSSQPVSWIEEFHWIAVTVLVDMLDRMPHALLNSDGVSLPLDSVCRVRTVALGDKRDGFAFQRKQQSFLRLGLCEPSGRPLQFGGSSSSRRSTQRCIREWHSMSSNCRPLVFSDS